MVVTPAFLGARNLQFIAVMAESLLLGKLFGRRQADPLTGELLQVHMRCSLD